MKTRTKIMLAGTAIVVTAAAGAGVAMAGNDDADTPITGDALDRATAAALTHTGGGRVTGTEVGDEDSYYEVEITLDNGHQIDVQLDESFVVVGSDPDDDTSND